MCALPITSRPVYGRLTPVLEAGCHIIFVEGAGLDAIEATFSGRVEVLNRAILLAVAPAGEAGTAARLSRIGADALHLLPTRETALVRLRGLLCGAGMSSRLYLAGSEDFISQAQALALAAGMLGDAIQAEACGRAARRVQCVHCKGFMDDVVHSPVTCRHCGTHLLVRDHFSRRLGAFMGVVIDAETPGLVPPPEALAVPEALPPVEVRP